MGLLGENIANTKLLLTENDAWMDLIRDFATKYSEDYKRLVEWAGVDQGKMYRVKRYLELAAKEKETYAMGTIDFSEMPITHLGNLKVVHRNLNLNRTAIQDLGQLESVRGNLFLRASLISSLGQLRFVGGYLTLNDSMFDDLDSLSKVEVRGSVDISGTPLSKRDRRETSDRVNASGIVFGF